MKKRKNKSPDLGKHRWLAVMMVVVVAGDVGGGDEEEDGEDDSVLDAAADDDAAVVVEDTKAQRIATDLQTYSLSDSRDKLTDTAGIHLGPNSYCHHCCHYYYY